MSFDITGKLIEKFETTAVSDKFKKREFILETKESSGSFDFTEYIKFQLVMDKCSLLDPFETGENMKVYFNLKGRKWEKDGKVSYFTNLDAWKIEKINEGNATPQASSFPTDEVPMPEEDDFTSGSGGSEVDDLPF